MKRMLTFDDVALQPYYNNVESRGEPSLDTWLTHEVKIGTPILAANMESVIGPELADLLLKRGSMPILHRFTSEEEIVKEVNRLKSQCFVSWGVNDLEKLDNNILFVTDELPVGVCLDIAHGHSLKMRKAIEYLRDRYSTELQIIAGNVSTELAVADLAQWGADAVKVGIGPGAACTTRSVTGFGAPQFSAIQECAIMGRRHKVPIIADGGIRNSRDIVLSLAAGACTVMLGKAFAATTESAAEKRQQQDIQDMFIQLYNKKYKDKDDIGPLEAKYRGQASAVFQKPGMKPEGEEAWVPVTGSAGDLMDDLEAGIRSGLTYGGARDISELQRHAIFVEVTPAYNQEMSTRL